MRSSVAFCLLSSLVTAAVAPVLSPESAYLSTQDARLRQADELEQQSRFDEAAVIYDDLINEGAGRDIRWTAYLLFRQASAQAQSGDLASAEESAGGAVNLDPDEPPYKSFLADLQAKTSGSLSSSVYHAERNKGSAKRLVATNGVLHIFVQGRNTLAWDAEEEEKTRHHIQVADQWLQARAASADVKPSPVFFHRYLHVTEEPFWRRADVPEADMPPDYRQAWLQEVLERFRADSYADLFDRTFDGMDLDIRSIVFHLLRPGGQLAMMFPAVTAPSGMESAFVASERTDWVNLYEPVSYTKEFLRLYGADDLSGKVQDPAVPENDVMNFGGGCLEDCQIGRLTRYAIGWMDQPPPLTILRLAALPVGYKRKKGVHG
jgi:hypothetical protein